MEDDDTGCYHDCLRKEESVCRTDFIADDEWAFCCFQCKCEEPSDHVVSPELGTEVGLYHRVCCHKIGNNRQTWQPPLMLALEKLVYQDGKNSEDTGNEIIGKSIINEKTRNAECQQAYFFNNQDLPDPISMLETSEMYVHRRFKFRKILEERSRMTKKPSMVVLSLFGGIGTALVALKRLDIDIKRHVHVEHNSVATHVVRNNHDSLYNPQLPNDGIVHTYVNKFEDFSVEMALEYGPIDLIIAGPPCQDYCLINANREGTQGNQGMYIIMLASFIEELQRRQSRTIFYLIENVILRREDSSEVDCAFKNGPVIEIDACYFSPTRRNRSYRLNFEVNSFDFSGPWSQSSPSTCLEDGWQLPLIKEKVSHQKANTFMASKRRLKDERMMKVRSHGSRFEQSHFSVLERERMMGFPDNYTSAVEELFNVLYDDALSKIVMDDDPWHKSLHPKYHHFSGESFGFLVDEKKVKLRIGTPKTGKTQTLLNAQEFCEHLLGNSFSVPVVEHLLSSLVPLFASKSYHRLNDKGKIVMYAYPFKWEKNNNIKISALPTHKRPRSDSDDGNC